MEIIRGSLLSAYKGLILHGCNCQGVMGSGVALAIKKKYPQAYLDYSNYCFTYGKVPKDLLGKTSFTIVEKSLVIGSMFTQEYYGRDGKQYVSYQAIEDCLHTIADTYKFNVPIHMPKIGCGLGGGTWDKVEVIVKSVLKEYHVTVYEL